MAQRRQYNRYKIKGSAIAVFGRPRLFMRRRYRHVKIGPIVNIGMGGICIEYLSKEKLDPRFREMFIMMPGYNFQADNIPFNIVSEYVFKNTDTRKDITRLNTQFCTLSQHHIFNLKRFISKYTDGYVKDRRSGTDRRYPEKADDPFIHIAGWRNDKGRRIGFDRRKA
jgi:hypothetical protein